MGKEELAGGWFWLRQTGSVRFGEWVVVFSQPYPFNRSIDFVKGSFRAGGDYEIVFPAHAQLTSLDKAARARVTSVLVEQRLRGVAVPRLTADDVRRAKESQPLPVHERAERLLRLLANHSTHIGENLNFDQIDDPHLNAKLFRSALAWSESTSETELNFLTDYLANQDWITKIMMFPGLPDGPYEFIVEVPGYRRIEESVASPDSSQCFVAMWFDPIMDEAYEKGVRPAIEEDSGYSALRIDRQEFIGKIDDEIIAEIRRSRFLVADFTHGSDGARGGVYYEAGFANGLGLPVIFTCHNDTIGELHFDTRQFNHIVWENPDDLRVQLTNRIGSVIGDGPNIDR